MKFTKQSPTIAIYPYKNVQFFEKKSFGQSSFFIWSTRLSVNQVSTFFNMTPPKMFYQVCGPPTFSCFFSTASPHSCQLFSLPAPAAREFFLLKLSSCLNAKISKQVFYPLSHQILKENRTIIQNKTRRAKRVASATFERLYPGNSSYCH